MKRWTAIAVLLLTVALLCCACNDANNGEEANKVYAFQSGETEIRMNAEAQPILEVLGTCLAYSALCPKTDSQRHL